MIDVTLFLSETYPGAGWSVVGTPQTEQEYEEALIWSNDLPKPTWDEVVSGFSLAEYEHEYSLVSDQRRAAYAMESDPIFFQWQRGEKTEQEWLDSVQNINARLPYPEQP